MTDFNTDGFTTNLDDSKTMTKPADDGNNITTMKALVFHGPNSLALEDRPQADDHTGNGRYRANHYDDTFANAAKQHALKVVLKNASASGGALEENL